MRVGDSFVVGHGGAAGEQFGESVVAEALLQRGDRLSAELSDVRDRRVRDGVGGAQEKRGGFVITDRREHAGDGAERDDEALAGSDSEVKVDGDEGGPQPRALIAQPVVDQRLRGVRQVDAVVVADGCPDADRLIEDWNRLHRVDGRAGQRTRGEPKLFDKTNSISQFDALPASDAVPDYACTGCPSSAS